MALPENSAFKPTESKIVRIDPEQGRVWKKLGLEFCSNNGWDWDGNAYLEEEFTFLDYFLIKLEDLGINGRDYVTFHEGYYTECFGFDDHLEDDFDCTGLAQRNLDTCAKFMEELGIEWNGWIDPPYFTLLATEQQILALIEKLATPIAEWKQENGYSQG